MNERERLDALEVALDNETKEREFYLKNASRTKNPLGKAMFQQIADEELEHHQRLKELHERWERKEKWPQTVPLKVNDTIVMDILKKSVQRTDKMPERDDDDLKAIQTAIDFEAKGASHYAKLHDEVSDPKEKEFDRSCLMVCEERAPWPRWRLAASEVQYPCMRTWAPYRSCWLRVKQWCYIFFKRTGKMPSSALYSHIRTGFL